MRPYFSICIPQHNRTYFLIESCRSMMRQTFKDFEVCISDDCSTDGKEEELLTFLKTSGLNFSYGRQSVNSRYDINLRASMGMAKGKYLFLLGNDDELASPTTLEEVHELMTKNSPAGVVITNYETISNKNLYRRIHRTGLLGSGPQVAARHFRDFAYFGGIILDAGQATRSASSKWDGSEMYQMFIGSRLIAEGMPLLGIDQVVVREGIQIPGFGVESYRPKARLRPCPIVERTLPFTMYGRVAVDSVMPFLENSNRERILRDILSQFVLFTYGYWIFEFRRVQSWKYALGICLGMRPKNIFYQIPIGPLAKTYLYSLYAIVTLLGLITPVFIFDFMRSILYWIAKGGIQRISRLK